MNAALQALFRCPDVQTRNGPSHSVIDACLAKLWTTRGQTGLDEFFAAVRTDTLPAGQDIGDSHELIQYLCDKVPWLDAMFRFRIAHSVKCGQCKAASVTYDSVLEFPLDSTGGDRASLAECIRKTVDAYEVPEWVCDTCKSRGGTRQQLIGTFPRYMMFHAPLGNTKIEYSSILVLNKHRYALSSVVCYNGSHWWTYGRDMPPGSAWHTLDDTRVISHGPKQFPISPYMRMLIYYRLDE